MYNAFKVVNWLRVRNNADVRTNPNVEELTQMKVMKLLYYIQAASLVITGHRMFDNDIVAYKYGPVVEEVHKKHIGECNISDSDIRDYNELQNDTQTADILNSIYKIYGYSSAYDLMRQTHNEAPWQETKQSEIISDKKMKDYYKHVFTVEH